MILNKGPIDRPYSQQNESKCIYIMFQRKAHGLYSFDNVFVNFN